MTHVALTCPRLGFTMGLSVSPRPGRLVDPHAEARMLEPLGKTLRRGPGWLDLEVGDSTEAVLACLQLQAKLAAHVQVESIVGSAAATDLIFGDRSAPASTAAEALRDLVENSRDDTEEVHQRRFVDFSGGCAIARHFTRLIGHPVPAAIAEHRLPVAPLVLWSVQDGQIVTIDREPFVVGRIAESDLQIDSAFVSRQHFQFERSNDGWRVRDLPTSTSGIFLNGERVDAMDLAPGMVVQLAIPHAFVVLSVQPAR